MKAKVKFDYPTIEGMTYAGTTVNVSREDFNKLKYSEKIKCTTDVGKIVWVPIKLLEAL